MAIVRSESGFGTVAGFYRGCEDHVRKREAPFAQRVKSMINEGIWVSFPSL